MAKRERNHPTPLRVPLADTNGTMRGKLQRLSTSVSDLNHERSYQPTAVRSVVLSAHQEGSEVASASEVEVGVKVCVCKRPQCVYCCDGSYFTAPYSLHSFHEEQWRIKGKSYPWAPFTRCAKKTGD